MRWWWKAIQALVRIGACAMFRVRVYGRQGVAQRGGLILAVNHQSYLDPLLVGLAIDREIHFMARKSLFQNPLFRFLIVTLNAFPIERDSGDVKGVKTALERLKRGCVLLMFPEGTRTRDGSIGRMKAGAGFIAAHAGVPILPVLIYGAYRVWPKQAVLPLPGEIRIAFGKPVDVSPDKEWAVTAEEIASQYRELQKRMNEIEK